MLIQNDPFGDFANAFANMFGVIDTAKNYKYNQQQKRQSDTDANALAQLQLQQGQQNIVKTKTDIESAGYDPTTGARTPSTVHYDPPPANPKGDDLSNWAAKQYSKAISANNGNGDPQGLEIYGKAILAFPRAFQETTGAQKNVAETANIRGLFAQQWKLAQAKFGNNLQMTLMREQGAAERAAKRAGVGKAYGSMSADEKNNLYMLMALDRLQGSNDERAFMNAYRQQTLTMDAWKQGEAAATKGLTGDDATTAAQQYEQQHPQPSPNINVTTGGDSGLSALMPILIQRILKDQGVSVPQQTPPKTGGGGGGGGKMWDGASPPHVGQLYKTPQGKYKVWNGSSWVPAS